MRVGGSSAVFFQRGCRTRRFVGVQGLEGWSREYAFDTVDRFAVTRYNVHGGSWLTVTAQRSTKGSGMPILFSERRPMTLIGSESRDRLAADPSPRFLFCRQRGRFPFPLPPRTIDEQKAKVNTFRRHSIEAQFAPCRNTIHNM